MKSERDNGGSLARERSPHELPAYIPTLEQIRVGCIIEQCRRANTVRPIRSRVEPPEPYTVPMIRQADLPDDCYDYRSSI